MGLYCPFHHRPLWYGFNVLIWLCCSAGLANAPLPLLSLPYLVPRPEDAPEDPVLGDGPPYLPRGVVLGASMVSVPVIKLAALTATPNDPLVLGTNTIFVK